ncbi:hypothetical protein ACOME3_001817 [Neoechinorhynchus agilis]
MRLLVFLLLTVILVWALDDDDDDELKESSFGEKDDKLILECDEEAWEMIKALKDNVDSLVSCFKLGDNKTPIKAIERKSRGTVLTFVCISAFGVTLYVKFPRIILLILKFIVDAVISNIKVKLARRKRRRHKLIAEP